MKPLHIRNPKTSHIVELDIDQSINIVFDEEIELVYNNYQFLNTNSPLIGKEFSFEQIDVEKIKHKLVYHKIYLGTIEFNQPYPKERLSICVYLKSSVKSDVIGIYCESNKNCITNNIIASPLNHIQFVSSRQILNEGGQDLFEIKKYDVKFDYGWHGETFIAERTNWENEYHFILKPNDKVLNFIKNKQERLIYADWMIFSDDFSNDFLMFEIYWSLRKKKKIIKRLKMLDKNYKPTTITTSKTKVYSYKTKGYTETNNNGYNNGYNYTGYTGYKNYNFITNRTVNVKPKTNVAFLEDGCKTILYGEHNDFNTKETQIKTWDYYSR